MSFDAGTRFGAYAILDPIGSGGMGQVYRARDTRLNRDVALKVLLPTVAADPDRLSRFSREAQLLASVNHPNIAHVYGIEEAAGVIALVMELVDGPTLADRIAQSAIPIAEALAIARQIAEALEAAHEQGIVHRDLKPANVKVRRDGTVKVLDFGLAKAIDPTASAARSTATMSPTLSIHATQAGIILGTAAYMSPEQAAGTIVDKRSDLWAFGVVLMEMLTGRAVFNGETVSHVLASVLTSDPDWKTLPADTPAPIRRLLRRCLEKDRKRRLDSAADARLEIEDALTPQPDHIPARNSSRDWRTTSIFTAVLGATVLTALIAWTVVRPQPGAAARPMRFAIVPPPSQPLELTGDRAVALSSDGTRMVYVSASFGRPQLMLRSLDRLEATPIRGTVGGRAPFLSPDGRWVGLFGSSQLRKVPITGGPPVMLCRTIGGSRGAAWLPDDTIVFATSDTGTGLLRVPAAGGDPQVLTRPDPSKGEQDHLFPFALPRDRGVLFTILPNGPIENAQVAVVDLKTGRIKTLIRGGTSAAYVEAGYLIYAVGETLQAVRFDIDSLEIKSDPAAVLEHVSGNIFGHAEFSVSRDGTLVYAPSTGAGQISALRSFVWVDRKGQEQPIKAPTRSYFYPRLSPDGMRVAVDIRDQLSDIWVLDLVAGTLQRVTFDPANDWFPVWTPDSKRIVFASGRAGTLNLFWQPGDGSGRAERLTTSPTIQWPYSFTPDGKSLVYLDQSPKTGFDLRLLHLDTMQSEPLVDSTATESNGEVSPDGRFLAYQSNETGQDEIFVRPFPNVGGGIWQISSEGGSRPSWSRNGRELFFLDSNGFLTAVSVQLTPAFSRGTPTRVLNTRYFVGNTGRSYDVSPDGRQFLMIKDATPDSNTTPASLVVVVDWFEELKSLVPH